MFHGSIAAIVTPMHSDETIDKDSFLELIEWHIRSKTDGLVITGSTGESATLDEEEQYSLLALAVKQVSKRIPVIAGTGTNSTMTTLKRTLNAKRIGADACLIVTPYYNRPTQNGLYKHYKTVAEQADFPVILYNVPGRTGCDLLPETVERLSELPQIIGIKEASGKVERAIDIIKRCHPSFLVYSGDDAIGLDVMLHGAKGIISVTANVAPQKMHDLCQAALSDDKKRAKEINHELDGLHHKLFVESNPIPTKWALHQMGLIPEGIRMPLTILDAKYHQEVNEAMQQAGVTL